MQDLLRRPEYTGENRCLPCTLLNVIVAIFISVVLLFVSPLGDILSYLIFVIVFLLSISMIYLRGYLVPKTPTLTKRFLPPWVLHLLGKDQKHQSVHSPISSTLRTQTKEGTQEQFLQDIGALRPCVEKQDLCLTESFRKEWNTEIESIKTKMLLQMLFLDSLISLKMTTPLRNLMIVGLSNMMVIHSVSGPQKLR